MCFTFARFRVLVFSSRCSWAGPRPVRQTHQALRFTHVAPCQASSKENGAGVWTLSAPAESRLEVKKSKFLVTAWPVSSPVEALARVKESSDPSASHNCFAYKVGLQFRSSDDGEPSGTAGRPILAAIEAEQLDGVCVLVTRFFGGVKLGSAGLVRAYGGAARACLRDAPRCPLQRFVTMEVQVTMDSIGAVYQVLEKHAADRVSEDFDPDGVKVTVRYVVDELRSSSVCSALMNATHGQASIREDLTAEL